MGNSEVGHLNIGAGRIIHMDVTRIDMMISSGSFFHNPVFLDAMRQARLGRLHLMGLLSDGGVHSMNTHLYALLRMARHEGVSEVFVHCFMDGRDTPPQSGVGYLQELEGQFRTIGVGITASVSGRYYAMDRDKRWERIERAFGAMVPGNGEKATDPIAAVRRSYERGITDEFIEPITILDQHNEPVGLIRDDDTCIFFNFRADRAREMTQALTAPSIERPPRVLMPNNLSFVTMTRYDKAIALPYAVTPEHPDNILAHVLSHSNRKNLRVAESEKYAHVTYFFNGGTETPYLGEERELIPSPNVATYDLKPAMSADKITEVVVKAIEKRDFDVIVMNFANADMVGHSGKMGPTVMAIEAVDACLGQIYQTVRRCGGPWAITADHGNAETMVDPVTGSPHTYHTTNPVPFILVGEPRACLRAGGALQDISPTILGLLGIAQPKEMRGNDLRIVCDELQGSEPS
jgi:2,3-bisphosphoglycerate-independent phosphoglycerate mutase